MELPPPPRPKIFEHVDCKNGIVKEEVKSEINDI